MHPTRYKFSKANSKNPLGTYIIDAARYEPKRSMSNSRLYSTIGVLIGAIFLCYTSLFYIPAALNMNMVLGTSTSQTSDASLKAAPNTPWYTPAVNFLRLKRGYFQAGSHIRAAYSSTPGTEITLYYSRCSGLPVIEVYSCPSGPIHKKEVKGHEGYIEIPVHKNGFYTFSQRIDYKDDLAPADQFYNIKWAR